jgi:hypothetical protein
LGHVHLSLFVSFDRHADGSRGSRPLTVAAARHQLGEAAEQNRSRFDPQIALRQDPNLAGLATIGIWQWGQSFIVVRRIAEFRADVKQFSQPPILSGCFSVPARLGDGHLSDVANLAGGWIV